MQISQKGKIYLSSDFHRESDAGRRKMSGESSVAACADWVIELQNYN